MEMPIMPTAPNTQDPVAMPARKFGFLDRFLFALSGCDHGTMAKCPGPDHTNARVLGLLIIFQFVYVTSLFSVLGTRLFANGHFRPEIVLVSAFLASFVAAIDVYQFSHAGNHSSGLHELKRGGLDLTQGFAGSVRSGFYLTARLVLSVGLAQLTAIGFGLILFADDIAARIDAPYRAANAVLMRNATSLVDGEIARAVKAEAAQRARVETLSAQVNVIRQTEIDPFAGDPLIQQVQNELARLVERKAKADEQVQTSETFAANEFGGIKGAPGNSGRVGRGLRYQAAKERADNAKTYATQIESQVSAARARLDALREKAAAKDETMKPASHEQLSTFEKKLAEEQSQLQGVKNELAQLTEHRNDAIQHAIETAPSFVARDAGMLAQIRVLERIAQEDTKIALVIILIDVVSFGFELAMIACKTLAYVPTTYSALLARDVYLGVVRIVDEMAAELNRSKLNPDFTEIDSPDLAADPEHANDNAPGGTETFGRPGDPAEAPKRKRGRPRKYPLPE